MKKIGMIGGLGWLSTIDYYRLLCSKTNSYFAMPGVERPLPAPHIFVDSKCFEVQGITFVNTAVAHVDAALARALAD